MFHYFIKFNKFLNNILIFGSILYFLYYFNILNLKDFFFFDFLLILESILFYDFFYIFKNNILFFLLLNILFFIILLLFINKFNYNLILLFSIIGSLFSFIISLFLLFLIPYYSITFGFNNYISLNYIDINFFYNIIFFLGIDGISLPFILLSTLLIPFCMYISFTNIKYNIKIYYILLLLTELFLVLIFSVLNIIFFYIFFESILIPMFLIIGIWGSRERKIHAAYQFFIYTLLGSILMLISIIYINLNLGTTNFFKILIDNELLFKIENYLIWLTFFFSFAVKIPMIPFHIWLPEAHVEAPTAGSVILAGVLLKLGCYGFLRILLSIFDNITFDFLPIIYTICLISIFYASFTTIRQIDLKKIIAYSSIVHMNFALLGLFTFSVQSLLGSFFLMLSHGLVSGGLFLSIGILYDRYRTRIIKYYNGLNFFMPIFSLFFFLFTLANVGFPTTSSFIGEFLIILGVFDYNLFVIFLGSSSLIFGGIYAFWLYNRIFFGPLYKKFLIKFCDINKREFYILCTLLILIFFFGFFPNFIFKISFYSLYINIICKYFINFSFKLFLFI